MKLQKLQQLYTAGRDKLEATLREQQDIIKETKQELERLQKLSFTQKEQLDLGMECNIPYRYSLIECRAKRVQESIGKFSCRGGAANVNQLRFAVTVGTSFTTNYNTRQRTF